MCCGEKDKEKDKDKNKYKNRDKDKNEDTLTTGSERCVVARKTKRKAANINLKEKTMANKNKHGTRPV